MEEKINNFGVENLVKALEKCSDSTKDEVTEKYQEVIDEDT